MLKLPADLEKCVKFHGHLCPGLVYGYLVAKEARRQLKLTRARDEEVVVISENDSCAVDALQIILGTTAGKGNLIFKDYGKNVFTVFVRGQKKALHFSRKSAYRYDGPDLEEYAMLEDKFTRGTASPGERKRQKLLKSIDLLDKGCASIFRIDFRNAPQIPMAPLSPSVACHRCGEMTMESRMVDKGQNIRYCLPCSEIA